MGYLNELVRDCLQNERAFCTAECPFVIDVLDFIGKLQQGRFNMAYRLYQNAVGFPGIVNALCPEPCKNVCPMRNAGGAISLKGLEKAAIEYARSQDPDQYNMPVKDKKVAVIGGGISGLACTLRLSTRKYQVTLFEKTDRIGGHLYELLPEELITEDIQRQFMHENYTLRLNEEITSLEGLSFDAIYIATGKNGRDFGLKAGTDGLFTTDRPGIFVGGSLTSIGTMEAIAHGLKVSTVIEGYMKIGKVIPFEENTGTKLPQDTVRVVPAEAVVPANGTSFTREEALEESKRCLKCACNACVHYSPLLSYYKKFPRRITEEVEISIHPSSLDGAATVATRLISTCNQCGLCKEVCPKDIDTGAFLLQSHRTMKEKGKMPWAFHEFFLRDMEFSDAEAALIKRPPGGEKCTHLFFPGCQLGASDPQYVIRSFQFLLKKFPGTALMIHCCGAAAEWAAEEKTHDSVIEKIKTEWAQLGKPKIVFACPMCSVMFRKHLPETEGEFLYTHFGKEDLIHPSKSSELTACVFDPCASRHEEELQQHIRKLASDAGFRLEALPMEGKMAECCTYGGHVSIAHPPFTGTQIKKRIGQSPHPYITYCSNCRDIFSKAGKETFHILDLAFGIDRKKNEAPGISDRRKNRLSLKKILLQKYWNEDMKTENPKRELLISPALKEKLDKAMILETDILFVIEHCEASGKKIVDPASGHLTGFCQAGNMTYWAVYKILDDTRIELINAYGHRMKIEGV